VEKQLSCRQPFDDAHGGTAAGTWPRRSWWCGDGRFDRWRWGAGKRLATLGQPAGAAPRREEAEIADADEALREHVQQEASASVTGRSGRFRYEDVAWVRSLRQVVR
jgi:hypothetical protein